MSLRLAFWPADGGRLELSGVFGGTPSRASNSATRAVSACTCAHSARIRASFSSCDRRLRSGSWVTLSFNRNHRGHVNRLVPHAPVIRRWGAMSRYKPGLDLRTIILGLVYTRPTAQAEMPSPGCALRSSLEVS